MSEKSNLWEWADIGDRSRIYVIGEISANGGFIIGGLKPSQAERIVEFHNEVVNKLGGVIK